MKAKKALVLTPVAYARGAARVVAVLLVAAWTLPALAAPMSPDAERARLVEFWKSTGLIVIVALTDAGNTPAFAAAVAQLRYTITFQDGEPFVYEDNVQLRPRYAYYRFPQGTVAYGPMLRDMPEAELDSLFSAAGLNATEQHVMKAISKLEGGFETVNTYDTGYVSIGFIQFVTLDTGRESLS